MNKITVYLVNYNELNIINNYDKYFKYLDKNELSKINSLKSKYDQVRSLLGLLLIKAFTIKNNCDYIIKQNEYGKPYLINNKFYYNISHSNEYVALGISNSDVGIDIEYDNKDNINYKEWTTKESFFKLIGKGLLMNDEDYKIDYNSNIINYNNTNYKFNNYHLNNYILSVSYKDNTKVNIKRLNVIELIELFNIIKPVN